MFTSLFPLPFSWKGLLSIACFVFSKPILRSATEMPSSFYSCFGLLLKGPPSLVSIIIAPKWSSTFLHCAVLLLLTHLITMLQLMMKHMSVAPAHYVVQDENKKNGHEILMAKLCPRRNPVCEKTPPYRLKITESA